jgi:rhamnopyranosyl-N-acetylglucosaminyl-diphospho-decaprenol beta-1,3/1,4-galactofuranosyltransferase
MNICAIIVAYNRLPMLRDCIAALRRQTRPLEGIIVVDNGSTDGSSSWLITQRDVSLVQQINMGSAGGFARGLQQAAQKGFELAWLMDDDCLADSHALEYLCSQLETPNVVALAPAVCNPGRGININHALRQSPACRCFPSFGEPVPLEDYQGTPVDLDLATYTGLLVKTGTICSVGLPKSEMFLHYDDIEYTRRLKQAGRVLLVPHAIVNHLSAAVSYFTESHRPKYSALWITYFGNRNRVWLARQCGASGPYFWIECLKGLLRKNIDIIRLDRDHRIKRIMLEWLAVWNGLRGNFDNDFPYRFLYGSRAV